jgi:phosphoglycolate phosphatase
MHKRAVIFDLDGTLIHSLDDLAAAANHAVSPWGVGPHSPTDYRMMIGDGAEMLIRRALGDAALEQLPAALERFQKYYADHMTVHTHLYEGVEAMLDSLVKRANPIAILSNKPHLATERVVAELLGAWSWAAVAGQRTGIPIKPDPTAAIQMAEQMARPPADCWFVGDSANDILTGRAAGMVSVGVTWGMRGRDELTDAGAEYLIDEPGELLNVMDAHGVQL